MNMLKIRYIFFLHTFMIVCVIMMELATLINTCKLARKSIFAIWLQQATF